MFYCNQYNDLRKYLHKKICTKYEHFEMLFDSEKINIIMSTGFVKHTTEYAYKAYYKRCNVTYNRFQFGANILLHFVTYKSCYGWVLHIDDY